LRKPLENLGNQLSVVSYNLINVNTPAVNIDKEIKTIHHVKLPKMTFFEKICRICACRSGRLKNRVNAFNKVNEISYKKISFENILNISRKLKMVRLLSMNPPKKLNKVYWHSR
jgi:hypothetical protein